MAQHEIRVEITADGSKAIAESEKVKGELKGTRSVRQQTLPPLKRPQYR